MAQQKPRRLASQQADPDTHIQGGLGFQGSDEARGSTVWPRHTAHTPEGNGPCATC